MCLVSEFGEERYYPWQRKIDLGLLKEAGHVYKSLVAGKIYLRVLRKVAGIIARLVSFHFKHHGN